MNNSELKLLSNKVETWGAERILAWAVERYAGRIVLTCSFGGGGIVLAHMVSRRHPEVPVLFLDTGFHFPETLQYKEDFANRYGVRVVDVRPALTVDEQAAQFGPELYSRNPDLCCFMRKVAPLARVLHDLQVDAWVSALRRDQSSTRRNIQILEWHTVTDPGSLGSSLNDPRPTLSGDDPAEADTGTSPWVIGSSVDDSLSANDLSGPEAAADDALSGDRTRRILKIQPLATWTRKDVWRYIHEHDLPYHPLLDAGYSSIGCAPCTAPTSRSDDERSGRWAGTDKVECGLHTFSSRS